LVALNEIDLRTRRHRNEFPQMHVIRVGTCGGLQATTPVGTAVITSYAVGLDNTGLFVEAARADEVCERLERELYEVVRNAMGPASRFHGKINPYVSKAHPRVVEALVKASADLDVKAKVGLTASSSGFFANQGRLVARLPVSVPDVEGLLAAFDPRVVDQRIENMEMESSFLLHLLGGLGHPAGAICPVISSRVQGTFDHDYQHSIEAATRVALRALQMLRSAAEA
jgi:uridine phosphorylase